MKSPGVYFALSQKPHIHWLLSTFLALPLLGGGNFMISEGLHYPYDSVLLASLGYLSFLLSMSLCHMLELAVSQRSCPSAYPASILSKESGLVPGFFYGLAGGVCIFLAHFSLILGWYLDPEGRSITYFMLAGVPPVTSILCFLLFREKLTTMQILGMAVAVAGIVVLGVAGFDGTWVSYFCGIGCLFAYSGKNVTGIFMKNKGMDVYPAGMINAAGEVVCGVVLLIFVAVFHEFSELLTMNWLFGKCLIGAILIGYGQYFINQAVMTGVVGVVITIINTEGVVFLALDYFFYDHIPNTQSLLACLVILIGVSVLLFGDLVLGAVCPRKDIKVESNQE